MAGGKELLRAMLSKDAATNFAKTLLAPTIVKGTVPADGFGSTALVSQTKLLDAAGTNIFSWIFTDYYGMNQDQLVPWNSFLDGKIGRVHPDQDAPEDHRQGGEGQLGQENRGEVTSVAYVDPAGRGPGGPRPEALRADQAGPSTRSASCWSSWACRWPST